MNRSTLPMAALLLLCSSSAWSQTLAANDTLPDSPGALLQAPSVNKPDAPQGTAQLHGTVLDTHGIPIPEANVLLVGFGKVGGLKTAADSDGAFVFTGVPAGDFHLIVTATGLDPYTSPVFYIKSGVDNQAPPIALRISTSSTVSVYATTEEIAQEQINQQEQQRVLGIFPNFYTSYIWDAAPLTTKQKYSLASRTFIDPVNFLVIGVAAGVEQATNAFSGYGQGAQGYGKRYGAGLADTVTDRYLSSAILPTLFHQDPRYFYQGTGGFRSRLRHALSSTFITRGDNGNLQPNYSHTLGSLTSGAISNAYHPASDRGAGLTFSNFGLNLAGNMADNFIREFVLRPFVPSIPQYAKGKQ